jgi:polar amino acid transport system ATP-binding protein/sulfate transport system ATP-binding protein
MTSAIASLIEPTPSKAYEYKDVLIRLEGIGISYGETKVISDLNAEVRDIVRPGCVTGQIIGILGPSGVGKTQLSRVMTGLQQPTTGKITVGTTSTPIYPGLVGFVAQNYPLFRHRTILGNLVQAAVQRGSGPKEAEAKAMDYLKRFSLEEKWHSYPAELSGGQRQRVAIAQQLLCSEHYLILDEPTTGLDPISKDRVCKFIKEVAEISEENTIFVVTHDTPAILTIADHLWLLGRKRDENGKSLGASIKYQHDLIERGLAWDPNPQDKPAYADLMKEIRVQFNDL